MSNSESVAPDSDIALCQQLADRADAISLAHFLAADLRVDTKPDLTPVTEADQAVERSVRELLADSRPSDTIVGEEYGGLTDAGLPAGRVWIIDPIDATKNYVRGVPIWATLIGLVVDGVATTGMVSAPALGKRWWANAGGGAWSTDRIVGMDPTPRPLRVSGVSTLGDASLSLSDRSYWADAGLDAAWDRLSAAVWRTRAYGDFYSHMLVASGAVDLAPEAALNLWDIAAIVPIVTEAGGTVTGLTGGDPLLSGSALTSNTALHAAATSLL